MRIRMKKILIVALASTAAFALAGCGKSQSADEEAVAESVELPAEETVPADASVAPVASEAAASEAAPAASGEASAAASAAPATPAPSESAK
jgi:uncharacterized lipoprotein NlpE involved in copper resistance